MVDGKKEEAKGKQARDPLSLHTHRRQSPAGALM
jgi:hypothetical protein